MPNPEQLTAPAAAPMTDTSLGARLKRAGKTLFRNRLTAVGVVVLLVVGALVLLAPWVSPYDPNEPIVSKRFHGPGGEHLLGTDQFGRDIFSRLLDGGRVSLLVGLSSTLLAAVVGTAIGAVAGYFGGRVDNAVMRVMDVIMAFPYIILAIALSAVFGPSLVNIVAIIAVTRVPEFARVVRGAVLLVREIDYVHAAKSIGQNQFVIMMRHILPNCLTPIIVLASLSMATAIHMEAAMSFLGLGIQPPDSSWGTMLSDARQYTLLAPWMAVSPGLAITLTIFGLNLLGDGLRDVLDPRFQRPG